MSTVCQVLGVARSNVHERANRSSDWCDGRKNRRPAEDEALVAEIRATVVDLPTYGYRRACELVRRCRRAEGRPLVNHMRVYRVMRAYALLLPRSPRRGADRRQDGRIAVEHSNLRCDMMLQAVEGRFDATEAPGPIEWLSDNGSPYIARDTRAFAKELGLAPLTTPIESPQSNGMAEAFVNTLKRDCVSVNPTPDARTILASLPRRIEHYNEHHPHSALKMRSPRMFRREQASAK